MSTLSDYMAGILARLHSAQGVTGELLNNVVIVREDAAEIETQVTEAIERHGMLIIIGQPSLQNTGEAKRVANLKIVSKIAIGEEPTIWRKSVWLVNRTNATAYFYEQGVPPDGNEVGRELAAGARASIKPVSGIAGTNTLAAIGGLVGSLTAVAAGFGGEIALIDGSGPGGSFLLTSAPVAMDVCERVMGLLVDYKLPGFQALRVQRADPVASKQRQIYEIEIESQRIIQDR